MLEGQVVDVTSTRHTTVTTPDEPLQTENTAEQQPIVEQGFEAEVLNDTEAKMVDATAVVPSESTFEAIKVTESSRLEPGTGTDIQNDVDIPRSELSHGLARNIVPESQLSLENPIDSVAPEIDGHGEDFVFSNQPAKFEDVGPAEANHSEKGIELISPEAEAIPETMTITEEPAEINLREVAETVETADAQEINNVDPGQQQLEHNDLFDTHISEHEVEHGDDAETSLFQEAITDFDELDDIQPIDSELFVTPKETFDAVTVAENVLDHAIEFVNDAIMIDDDESMMDLSEEIYEDASSKLWQQDDVSMISVQETTYNTPEILNLEQMEDVQTALAEPLSQHGIEVGENVPEESNNSLSVAEDTEMNDLRFASNQAEDESMISEEDEFENALSELEDGPTELESEAGSEVAHKLELDDAQVDAHSDHDTLENEGTAQGTEIEASETTNDVPINVQTNISADAESLGKEHEALFDHDQAADSSKGEDAILSPRIEHETIQDDDKSNVVESLGVNPSIQADHRLGEESKQAHESFKIGVSGQEESVEPITQVIEPSETTTVDPEITNSIELNNESPASSHIEADHSVSAEPEQEHESSKPDIFDHEESEKPITRAVEQSETTTVDLEITESLALDNGSPVVAIHRDLAESPEGNVYSSKEGEELVASSVTKIETLEYEQSIVEDSSPKLPVISVIDAGNTDVKEPTSLSFTHDEPLNESAKEDIESIKEEENSNESYTVEISSARDEPESGERRQLLEAKVKEEKKEEVPSTPVNDQDPIQVSRSPAQVLADLEAMTDDLVTPPVDDSIPVTPPQQLPSSPDYQGHSILDDVMTDNESNFSGSVRDSTPGAAGGVSGDSRYNTPDPEEGPRPQLSARARRARRRTKTISPGSRAFKPTPKIDKSRKTLDETPIASRLGLRSATPLSGTNSSNNSDGEEEEVADTKEREEEKEKQDDKEGTAGGGLGMSLRSGKRVGTDTPTPSKRGAPRTRGTRGRGRGRRGGRGSRGGRASKTE